MQRKKIHDKEFEVYLSEDQIQQRLKDLGSQISNDFQGQKLLVIGVLNGSFMVLADLCRYINLDISIEFLKISSYSGTESTGQVKSIFGLNQELTGMSVLIIEDIVDTGLSMKFLLEELQKLNPNRIAIMTLLFKKEAFRYNYPLDYVGFEIPNKFVVGYGLDYDGHGRNLPDIYQLCTP
jgi:hypoxanthine phosphoribosyltransferase